MMLAKPSLNLIIIIMVKRLFIYIRSHSSGQKIFLHLAEICFCDKAKCAGRLLTLGMLIFGLLAEI